ncbi:hypothetical protein CSUB01_12151 [Colletotrichum sublineola]|uniref:Uncharacterized protein n=1 Tax=Colletotrichum sublineola TaxID=1173701 RepID=A0A066XQY1_COLSU|nr:hypothetical protein CSUB01_12151 [Colletotrichum sublineola]
MNPVSTTDGDTRTSRHEEFSDPPPGLQRAASNTGLDNSHFTNAWDLGDDASGLGDKGPSPVDTPNRGNARDLSIILQVDNVGHSSALAVPTVRTLDVALFQKWWQSAFDIIDVAPIFPFAAAVFEAPSKTTAALFETPSETAAMTPPFNARTPSHGETECRPTDSAHTAKHGAFEWENEAESRSIVYWERTRTSCGCVLPSRLLLHNPILCFILTWDVKFSLITQPPPFKDSILQ